MSKVFAVIILAHLQLKRQPIIDILTFHSWYKFMKTNNNKKLVKLDERVTKVGGTLIIKEAKVEDSGKYLCMVNNTVGGESVETVLTVTGKVRVEHDDLDEVTDKRIFQLQLLCLWRWNPSNRLWIMEGQLLSSAVSRATLSRVSLGSRMDVTLATLNPL